MKPSAARRGAPPLPVIGFILFTSLFLVACGSGSSAEDRHSAGSRLLKGERPAEALVELDAAIELDPELAAAYADRAMAYLALGEIDLAAADLDEAVRLDPGHAPPSTAGECCA